MRRRASQASWRRSVLRLEGVSRRFGGVVATDGVTLEVRAGEVHALIGPNGAGKTTLIGQISGSVATDRGEIRFLEHGITAAPQHYRVRLGLARSYQITSIFRRFSVLDNLALAVQARSGSSFSFWRPVSVEGALFDEARAVAAEVGLSERISIPAGSLAHGEQRALEVGLALATRPRLVLLDEPMAGMGPEESRRMIELIERIRARVTVLLVEHDMDAVFRLADRISVMVNGRLIATDAPQSIKANEEVRMAYLGDEIAA
jgi:branched-chain amino acid transport system ATP-binding protein